MYRCLLLLTLCACASPEAPHCEGTQIVECYVGPDPSETDTTCTDRVIQDCADRDSVCEESARGPECVPASAPLDDD